MAKKKGRPRMPGGKGDHQRSPELRKRPVVLTADLNKVVEDLADEIAEPGMGANFSQALRKIIAEWSTGKAHDGTPIKRGRKKSEKNPD